ncbi:MAG: carbohydrate ABC transporter permease [Clostridiaceae bacterium]
MEGTLKQSKPNRRRIRLTPGRLLTAALLVILAVVILYPLFWMIVSSMKSYAEIYGNVWGFPETWLVDNYRKAWEGGIADYFLNSLQITGAVIVSVIFIATLAAYGLSRFKSRLVDLLLIAIMAGLMVNPQVCLIPLYKFLDGVGLLDTKLALILPYIAFRLPLSILLVRSHFLTIPKEIVESAIVDGCSELEIYSKIYLPMSRPIISTIALLTAFYAWNEFLFGIIFISSEANKTIPAGLMNFRDALRTDWGVLLAGMVIASLPMIVLLIFTQKQLIRGLSEGSVKG